MLRFQDAAKKIQARDEYALAPFYLLYQTVRSPSTRRSSKRSTNCAKAANAGNGIELQDANVLKLLYLIRYVGDVKATLNNLVILSADNIQLDATAARDAMQASLDRLLSRVYQFRRTDLPIPDRSRVGRPA